MIMTKGGQEIKQELWRNSAHQFVLSATILSGVPAQGGTALCWLGPPTLTINQDHAPTNLPKGKSGT